MSGATKQNAPRRDEGIVQRKIQDLRLHPLSGERATMDAERNARWGRGHPAAILAVEAVKNGISAASEISVAMSASEEEAERYRNEANHQLISKDPVEMGIHLATRLEEIDKVVQKSERGEVPNFSPEKKKFVEEKFRELCTSLDTVSRDPDLIDNRPDLRSQLFPKVALADRRPLFAGVHAFIAAQYNNPSSPAPAPVGPKGVADLMNSEAGKSARQPEPSNDQNSSQLGKLFRQGLKMVGNLVQGRSREASSNVCQR